MLNENLFSPQWPDGCQPASVCVTRAKESYAFSSTSTTTSWNTEEQRWGAWAWTVLPQTTVPEINHKFWSLTLSGKSVTKINSPTTGCLMRRLSSGSTKTMWGTPPLTLKIVKVKFCVNLQFPIDFKAYFKGEKITKLQAITSFGSY